MHVVLQAETTSAMWACMTKGTNADFRNFGLNKNWQLMSKGRNAER